MNEKSVLSNEYNKIFIGLADLSRAVRGHASPLPVKLQAMEEKYLQNTSEYTEIEREKIRYFREAFSYKFYLSSMHLEQLWSLIHIGKEAPLLKQVLINIYDAHRFNEDKTLLHSFTIEGFIIQGTAFLDFYMLYLCSIFKINETDRLSGRKFIKSLKNVEGTHKARAEQVHKYFSENVFSDSTSGAILSDRWGELIKKLRNSLVHRDELSPDFENEVLLLNRIIGEWPEELMDLTCSRFCQDVQNVMFYMMTHLAAVVYGLEYKPGPYRPDMW